MLVEMKIIVTTNSTLGQVVVHHAVSYDILFQHTKNDNY